MHGCLYNASSCCEHESNSSCRSSRLARVPSIKPAQERCQLLVRTQSGARAASLTVRGRINCDGAGDDTCSKSRLPHSRSSTPASLSMQSKKLPLDSPSRLGAASNRRSSCVAICGRFDRTSESCTPGFEVVNTVQHTCAEELHATSRLAHDRSSYAAS